MSGDVFVDTNVLVYDQDSAEWKKQPIAHAWLAWLWESRRGRLSVQVLSEYYVTVTRKLKPGRASALARADVQDLGAWRPLAIDETVLAHAWAVEERYGLSWWDALIVGAAQVGGCRYLLSEDLQDGQDLGGLRVVNPFGRTPGDLPTGPTGGSGPASSSSRRGRSS